MKKYILLSILSILSSIGSAQKQLELEDVEVLKVFNAKLVDVKMIHLEQSLPIVNKTKPNYQYHISDLSLTLTYPEPVIRPIAIKKEPLGSHKNGYIKLGGGYPNTLYGDGSYNFHYANLYDFNINANYYALNNSKKLTNQKFLNWGIDLDGKYHFNESSTLKSNINIGMKDIYYFNMDSDTISKPKNTRKIYKIAIMTSYGNDFFNEQNFIYNIAAGIKTLNLKNENLTETSIPIDLDLKFKYTNHLDLGLDTKVRLNFLRSVFIRNNDSEINSFHVIPRAIYHQPKYSISGGIDMIINSDENTLIYPRIDMKFELWKDLIVLSAGINSKHHDNNLNNILEYNPYIEIHNLKLSGNIQKKYYAGINGTIKKINYHLEVGYQLDQNKMQYIVTSINNNSYLRLSSDSINTNFIKLDISYPITKQLTIGTTNTYNKYKSINNRTGLDSKYVYGHPALQSNIYIRYNALNNKLHVEPSFFIESGMYMLAMGSGERNTEKTNSFFHVQLTASYDITNNISTFLNLDNITGSDYQKWYGFKQAPFNILGGAKVKF